VNDVEIYISILKKKYPEHYFEPSIGMKALFVYGDDDSTI